MFRPIKPSSGLDVHNLKIQVKCIKLCGNLGDLINFTILMIPDYFVRFVYLLDHVAMLLYVQTFSYS
jgi:hypothetical protein